MNDMLYFIELVSTYELRLLHVKLKQLRNYAFYTDKLTLH
jgi:hypothetical protein